MGHRSALIYTGLRIPVIAIGLTVRQAYKIAALQSILSSCGFDDSMKQPPEHFAE